MLPKEEKVVIILFTRYPEVGQVKTRLIPALGDEGAAACHEAMTAFTVQQIQKAVHGKAYEVHIQYTGACEDKIRAWLGYGDRYVQQGEGDLGARMHAAFQVAFDSGATKVLLLGSDCPDNRSANIHEALCALNDVPCVLGPTHDGGYYMVGLTHPHEHIFKDMTWGTNVVLKQTLAKLDSYTLLPTLHDVDYGHDIPKKISVIIPTYNEEKRVAHAIQSALQGFNVEVLVVDGGSSDATGAVAQSLGSHFFLCPPEQRGRAQQMNWGAKKAQGDIVLFLHADSQLPVQWDMHVREALQDDDIKLGFFRFAVTGDFAGKNLLTWGTNIRAQCFHKPYGDQGFFLRKEHFYALGGYDDVPILEDVLLAKKAKAQGEHICVPLPLHTSGRRWKELGPLKVTLFNQAVLLAAALGMDLQKLHKAYRAGSFRAVL